MFKNLLKVKYHWHSYLHRYNEILKNDCLSNDIRAKLAGKATYHQQKATSLLVRI